jgi:hypothetical protein
MKIIQTILFTYCGFLLVSCGEKMTEDEIREIGTTQCQGKPAYLSRTGLNPARIAFSTSERKTMGLVLVQVPENSNDTVRKTWSDPSWKKFGWMSSIATDDQGNVYVTPYPLVNILENPPAKANIIYKVDNKTAEMKPLADLPKAAEPSAENVFGLLNIYFDCHAKLLYASSVAGSTRNEEKGIIYAVDPEDGKVKDKLTGTDAMSLCIAGVTGEKRLFYGSSRIPEIYSIELTKEGKFKGSPRKELSLDLLGPRGDDKARKIRFDKNGYMEVYGVEFNYNLTAPTEKQETRYRFQYNDEEKKWEYMK